MEDFVHPPVNMYMYTYMYVNSDVCIDIHIHLYRSSRGGSLDGKRDIHFVF